MVIRRRVIRRDLLIASTCRLSYRALRSDLAATCPCLCAPDKQTGSYRTPLMIYAVSTALVNTGL